MTTANAIDDRSRQQLLEEMLDDIKNTVPGAAVAGPGDDLFDIAWGLSALAKGQRRALARAVGESFDDTASFEALVKRHRARVGEPTAATAAVVTARITGTAGSTWATTDRLVSSDNGLIYAPVAGGTMPVAETTDIDVECETAGDAGALASGSQLVWMAAPAGISPIAATTGDPEGGTNAEDVESYRARVLDWMRRPTAGGTAHDFERWALGVTGVGFATAFPNRRALGTCDVAVLDHEGDNVSAPVLADVQDALDENRPVCAKGSQAVSPVLTPVTVHRRLTLSPGYTFATFAAKTVQSGSTTTSIVVDSLTDVAAGDWIAVKCVVNGRTRFAAREIYSVSDGATKVINLVAALPAAPAAGVAARPAGPGFDQIAANVQAYFQTLRSGGTFYNAICGRYVQQSPEVLNDAHVLPATDTAAVVTESTIEHLVLGDLILEGV